MGKPWIDLRALKSQVAIRDVLARYGFLDRLTEKKPGVLTGACPVHGGSNTTSFVVDTNAVPNKWNCFSGCKLNQGEGNVLGLVMRLESCSVREAAEKLCEWFGIEHSRNGNTGTGENLANASQKSRAVAASSQSSRQDRDMVANPPLARPLQNLNAGHPYLVERRLTVPTIKHFGIGHCVRGIMRGRIAIPIENERSELVAYAGRAVADDLAQEKGKYRLPDGFKKSHVVYNLNRAAEHAGNGLVVVEGFFGAMHVHQAGFENVVALMGSTLADEQAELLVDNAERLVLMFDGDDAGKEGERSCYRVLRTRTFLKSVHLADGEQPDALSSDQICELLS